MDNQYRIDDKRRIAISYVNPKDLDIAKLPKGFQL